MDDLGFLSDDDAALLAEVMDAHGFDSLKKTQQLAFQDGVLSPGNHLLVAETGNGKTLCAEAVTKKTLQDGGRVAYLVPSRQLVRAKAETISTWAREQYDIGYWEGAYHNSDVIVATFDSFYRAILNNTGRARNLDLVVLDDFHEIYGGFRGPEIEKSIGAAMYEGIEVFAMSATVGNPEELASWMDADCTVSPEGRQIEIEERAIDVAGREKKEAIVDVLRREEDKAPFLVFNYAKSWTESRAKQVAQTRIFETDSERDYRREMRQKVNGEVTETLEDLGAMMNAGVAFHHADLPRDIQEWIIDLYKEGEIRCLFATTTIAYGFDAPVQSVLVADITRGPQDVGVWEYVQWVGRAARPGYGYDVGYAYTLTDEPQETTERYFEPHRELEPVGTHFENQEQFRWLLLQLVVTGWDTPHEIEAFVKELLYWEQMKQIGAWGRQHEPRDERLNERLRGTADWLDAEDFVDEKQTTRQFMPTALGEGAVSFAFNSFVSVPLSAVKAFYLWVEETPHDDVTPLTLTETTARLFDRTLNATSASSELTGHLQEHDLQPEKPAITAGVICWYWMQNMDTREIEDRTEVDAAYISSTARKLSDAVDATKHLTEAAPNARQPEWFDTHVFRVERGVRRDEVPLVENVQGLGRYRVRMLRRYLERSDIAGIDGKLEGSLWEMLVQFRDRVGSAEFFEDTLRGNVNGIGEKTAERLREFVETGSIDADFAELGSGPVTPRSGDDEEAGFTRGTRLDEF